MCVFVFALIVASEAVTADNSCHTIPRLFKLSALSLIYLYLKHVCPRKVALKMDVCLYSDDMDSRCSQGESVFITRNTPLNWSN